MSPREGKRRRQGGGQGARVKSTYGLVIVLDGYLVVYCEAGFVVGRERTGLGERGIVADGGGESGRVVRCGDGDAIRRKALWKTAVRSMKMHAMDRIRRNVKSMADLSMCDPKSQRL